jgi:hypothetical protein
LPEFQPWLLPIYPRRPDHSHLRRRTKGSMGKAGEGAGWEHKGWGHRNRPGRHPPLRGFEVTRRKR